MIILRDTREQKGWNYPYTTSFYLQEGDYTTQEIYDAEQTTGRKILRIERKASASELALNFGKKRKAFTAELERLSEYEHSYLILECTEQSILDFPYNAKIPFKLMKKVRIKGPYIWSILNSLEDKYGIKVIFCGSPDEARHKAYNIMLEHNNELKNR